MKKRGKKRKGLTSIIVAIILVALSLVAIGIVWAIIIHEISKSSKDASSIEKLIVDAEIKGVEINQTSNNISILVKRNPGIGNLTGFKFIFKNKTDAESKTIGVTISELLERVFTFHLNMNVSQVLTITMVPLIKSTDEDVFGISKVYDVKEGGNIPSGSGGEPICGNNIIEQLEVCDGTDLEGETCKKQGFTRGNLTCNPDCLGFNTSECYLHGQNFSDGFDIGFVGANSPLGISFDTRDNSFWIINGDNDFVYHFNSTGANQTDGFDIGSAGANSPRGIAFDTTNNSFWIIDSGDPFDNDQFVYHFSSSGINLSNGFNIGSAGANSPFGITFDTRDNSFWVTDADDDFIYHFSSSGINQGDNFNIESAGANSPRGVVFDTSDNSFWIVDFNDQFVYHFNSTGANQTDGFDIGSAGANSPIGIAFDTRDNSFWVVDFNDQFVYHFLD